MSENEGGQPGPAAAAVEPAAGSAEAAGGSDGRRRWKQRPALSLELRTAIDEQASTIRRLSAAVGTHDPVTQQAVARMRELRRAAEEELERQRAAMAQRHSPVPPSPPQKRQLLSPKKLPPSPATQTPDFLRGHAPRSPLLTRRAACPGSVSCISALHRGKLGRGAAPAALEQLERSGCGCTVCRWNHATLALASGDAAAAAAAADRLIDAIQGECDEAAGAPHGAPTQGEALLIRGMARELGGDNSSAGADYEACCAADRSLSMRYFGFAQRDLPRLTHALSFFADPRLSPTPPWEASEQPAGTSARSIQVSALLDLWLRHEFGRVELCQYPPVAWAGDGAAEGGGAGGSPEARELRTALHCCVRHLLPEDVRTLLSKHYAQLIDQGLVPFGDRRTGRYYAYNDPLARFLMAQLQPLVAELAGCDVKASYAYMISYRDCSELHPHQDREAAEYVVSMQLDITPADDMWPLRIGAEPQEPHRGDKPKPPPHLTRYHVMRNGDAVVFRGRRLIHWREPIAAGCAATMLLVHYVDAKYDGPLKTGLRE
eukprot:TRINITY_DN24839_c0_g1_i1.p1 TRINITY_DN24839_c0_g1~~TRINITY_DN24839_c0_g1_i1.p1  ORF type:complete len:546 (+),score=153.92 TRINITY_DN24839_c0_g1_i1:284-1921(+)